jgi:hypothetical protein
MTLKLRRTRKKTEARERFGEWYVIDEDEGRVVQHHVDLEKFARELGCLKPWEELVPDKKRSS